MYHKKKRLNKQADLCAQNRAGKFNFEKGLHLFQLDVFYYSSSVI